MGGAANGLANEDAFSGLVPRQVSIYGTSGSNRDTLYGILQTFGMGSTSQRNGNASGNLQAWELERGSWEITGHRHELLVTFPIAKSVERAVTDTLTELVERRNINGVVLA